MFNLTVKGRVRNATLSLLRRYTHDTHTNTHAHSVTAGAVNTAQCMWLCVHASVLVNVFSSAVCLFGRPCTTVYNNSWRSRFAFVCVCCLFAACCLLLATTLWQAHSCAIVVIDVATVSGSATISCWVLYSHTFRLLSMKEAD